MIPILLVIIDDTNNRIVPFTKHNDIHVDNDNTHNNSNDRRGLPGGLRAAEHNII